ncbi:MAG: hypothetical protein SFV51_03040 [Bryobacteraceae bacterium]|nr:hypothetical protein [Bryobacteraceae bacterium]
MKKFQFQLEAALSWRRQKEQTERIRLDELNARRQSVLQQREQAERDREASRRQTLALPSISALDLESLDNYSHAVESRKRKLEAEVAELDEAARKQQLALIEASRQTKLLEKLKDRQHSAWQAEYDKQLEADATESFLGQWGQNRGL